MTGYSSPTNEYACNNLVVQQFVMSLILLIDIFFAFEKENDPFIVAIKKIIERDLKGRNINDTAVLTAM